jgi:hypothetical protein
MTEQATINQDIDIVSSPAYKNVIINMLRCPICEPIDRKAKVEEAMFDHVCLHHTFEMKKLGI